MLYKSIFRFLVGNGYLHCFIISSGKRLFVCRLAGGGQQNATDYSPQLHPTFAFLHYCHIQIVIYKVRCKIRGFSRHARFLFVGDDCQNRKYAFATSGRRHFLGWTEARSRGKGEFPSLNKWMNGLTFSSIKKWYWLKVHYLCSVLMRMFAFDTKLI